MSSEQLPVQEKDLLNKYPIYISCVWSSMLPQAGAKNGANDHKTREEKL